MSANLLLEQLDLKAMPQIEVEKMLNVLLLRKRKGYSQFELSFLMGQRDFYVRDIENPNHTLVYAVPFANIFRQIFDCEIQAIVPNINSRPSYSIRILGATNKTGNTFYRAEKQIEGNDWELITEFGTEEKKILLKYEESEIFASEEAVVNWVLGRIEAGYFDVAKNALQIFKDCSAELNGKVRPLFLANALKSCNGTKGLPKLTKEKDRNGRFVYEKGVK
ncbi:hypothetical protein M1D52_09420 [Olivibacter sp. SA151]|uniref:hypothetical protein n=1 Tax=Olivibacter jilunii TaxID=985016 RepID=UPI003F143D86